MFEEIYLQDYANQTRDLELMTTGVIAEAGNLITEHVEAVANNKLTLENVCHIADRLNSVLSEIERKKKEIEYTQKKLAEQRAKTQETGATA